ncbi:hypothetical protein [Bacillus sp. NPDC077027]|uniref:hypothetical protein n=1 Tax=Bacillus sp. NPDC077027 TaxID=3390548 RepID=UPI003D040C25
MDKLSTTLLNTWLRVPRWFRQWILCSVIILFFYAALLEGIEQLQNLTPSTLITTLIASIFLFIMFHRSREK